MNMVITHIPVLEQFLFYSLTTVFGSIWAMMRAYELYQQLRNSRYRLALTIIECAVQKTYDTYKKSERRWQINPGGTKKGI